MEQIKIAMNGKTYISDNLGVSEHDDQVTLFRWAYYSTGKYPELKLLAAIPNGGKRDGRTGAILKAEGVKPGIPDIILPVARGGYHGLFIELKRADLRPSKEKIMSDYRKGGLSIYQSEWLNALRTQGYQAGPAYGFEDAKNIILDYLKGKKYEKI
ncbi:MAG: VRR-NUC domain-containing protein [Oscillospiraceae bacterium]|nr:VRR-NUC domain-containing protein [Oscillospiraceae bacterium]